MPRGRGATRPSRGSDARDGAHPVKRQKVAVVHAHATDVGLCGRKVKLTIQSAATCHNAAGRRRIFRIKAPPIPYASSGYRLSRRWTHTTAVGLRRTSFCVTEPACCNETDE